MEQKVAAIGRTSANLTSSRECCLVHVMEEKKEQKEKQKLLNEIANAQLFIFLLRSPLLWVCYTFRARGRRPTRKKVANQIHV